MPTLKACSSGWPARAPYNGLANPPVSQPDLRNQQATFRVGRPIFVERAAVRKHCATILQREFQPFIDLRPSRALTMERLADLRSSDVPPGSGQTRQHKGV
jgi:hypothetical protein